MSDACSSVMSHTTKASSVARSGVSGGAKATSVKASSVAGSSAVGGQKTPSVVSSKAASAVSGISSMTGSKVGGRSKVSATTSVLNRQLADLENELEAEKSQRRLAAAELKKTADELEALEKILKLKV